MEGGIETLGDARRLASQILQEQRDLDIAEMGVANTPEEALAKAKLLFAMQEGNWNLGKKPEPLKKTRCKGSVPDQGQGSAFVGDRVILSTNLDFVRQAVEASGSGWNNLIEGYLGTTGVIRKILSVDMVRVQFPDSESWVLPSSCLTRALQVAAASPIKTASPRRGVGRPPHTVPEVKQGNGHKVLLVADTTPMLEDCHTAYRYLLEEGFHPAEGVKVMSCEGNGSAVIEGMRWLVDGARTGDASFMFLAAGEGDGVFGVPGAELLKVLRTLPAGSKLTAVVGAHCCGGGGALLDLPYTMAATREGGITYTERPVGSSSIAADVTVIGTWTESPLEDAESTELMTSLVQSLTVAYPPAPQQLLKDLRTHLYSKHGHSCPLPKLASTRPFTTISLLPRQTSLKTPPHSSHIPHKDYTTLAASRLLPPTITGKCIGLGDADARAWVIFHMADTLEPHHSKISAYNGHPCFVLNVYNWVDNDDVRPLGDTVMEPHRNKPGNVYRLSVYPGETKEFLEGVLHDGDGWRPGWWQDNLPEEFTRNQEAELQSQLVKSHTKTRALADILEIKGVETPDCAFSCVSLLEAAVEVDDTESHHYDLWFPPQPQSALIDTADDPLCWGRPVHYSRLPYSIIPAEGILPNDITPGKIRNTAFLSAMACLAEQPKIIETLFSGNKLDYQMIGAVRLQLCVKGWWQDITLDTMLPMLRRPLSSVMWIPAGAHSSKEHPALWPALLEKALAKVYGGYHELVKSRDTIQDMLGILSGGWVTAHMVDGLSFNDVCNWLDRNEIVVLLPSAANKERHAPKTLFAYPVIQYDRERELLCLRDNWDKHAWGFQTDRSDIGGGKWVPFRAVPERFMSYLRHYEQDGGELRVWVTWEGDLPLSLVQIEVTTPTLFRVAAHVQECNQSLGTPVTVFTYKHGVLKVIKTSHDPFELSVTPTACPVYVGINAPPPCQEGVVLTFLYRTRDVGMCTGHVTTVGPAHILLNELSNPSGYALPELSTVDTLAQHRRNIAIGAPPVLAEFSSTFVL
eukprot:TRINITY_DN5233_c0_g3_i3.p1 TRINITY_DN5233_c0_g3~~TRINITY_DN5233_c0_g3_i3.p1  ORF type:complete len:1028 (+),score=209.59 TRINITY_DN5233_c0_g3_i3:3611-6694(+)